MAERRRAPRAQRGTPVPGSPALQSARSVQRHSGRAGGADAQPRHGSERWSKRWNHARATACWRSQIRPRWGSRKATRPILSRSRSSRPTPTWRRDGARCWTQVAAVRTQIDEVDRRARVLEERSSRARRVVDFATNSDALGRVLLAYWDEIDTYAIADPTNRLSRNVGSAVIRRIDHEEGTRHAGERLRLRRRETPDGGRRARRPAPRHAVSPHPGIADLPPAAPPHHRRRVRLHRGTDHPGSQLPRVHHAPPRLQRLPRRPDCLDPEPPTTVGGRSELSSRGSGGYPKWVPPT